MVKFKIKYPKDYKGKKYHKDGDIVEVSEESAAIFTERKIGKVVEGDEAEDTDETGASGEATDTDPGAAVTPDPNAGKVVGSTGGKVEEKKDTTKK